MIIRETIVYFRVKSISKSHNPDERGKSTKDPAGADPGFDEGGFG